MAISKKYTLAAVQLDTGADVLISGITSQSLQLNSEVDQEITSGNVYPAWYGLSGQSPGGQFGTHHLATALAAIGGLGLDISTLATGLALWLYKHADASTRAGAASHRKFLCQQGIVVPRTLSVSDGPGQHAVITYEILTTFDGTNNPWVIGESQTLPNAEPDDERFALGPMKIGNKTLSQVRQFDVDFGINVVAERGDGDIWPTFCSIETISPSITLRGIDPEWFKDANVPLAGLAGVHANTVLYLRKRAAGQSFVADNVAEHIKFTGDGLAHIVDGFDVGVSGAAECSLVMPLRNDGSNAPLTIDTASTIT